MTEDNSLGAHSDDLLERFDRLVDETGAAVVVDEERRRAVADLSRFRLGREVERARLEKLGFLRFGVDGDTKHGRDVVLGFQVVKVIQVNDAFAVKQLRLPEKDNNTDVNRMRICNNI